MTTRKPTKAQLIAELKVEVRNKIGFTESSVREAEALREKSLTAKLTKRELKRAEELAEIINRNRKFIETATREIREFYRPASA